ncbi:MAG: aminomethyltransferase family protein [Thiolinea sp.]
MTESTRTSALASRHRELGSGLEDWNGMGTAWSYDTDPCDEHDAVREAAGMFDMSPLKKVYLRGADAAAVANQMITRDLSKIGPGQATYGSVLTEQGTVADDAIISCNSDNEWMLVHGSGDSMALLEESAQGKQVSLELDDNLHDLSVQGPKSLEILNANTPLDLEQIKYYHHQATELFGHPCRISRTGYSGERGYEIFADGTAITEIWDQLVGAGVMPCSFTSLDKARIEAGLLFYGYDMTDEHTPWETGLGFTIADNTDFRGREALLAAKGKERFRQSGLVVQLDDMLAGGETLHLNGEEVGVVNSPCYSHRLQQSLALGHIRPDAAQAGTVLEVRGEDMNCSATVNSLPFYDPQKLRVRG